MTILTIPSFGVKKADDKLPLVNDADRVSTPPHPHVSPKQLESGEALLCVEDDPLYCCKMLSLSVKTMSMICVSLLCLMVFFADNPCKANEKTEVATPNYFHLEPKPDVDNDTATTTTTAATPYKSYTSYAAAESDMLSEMTSSPASVADKDYDNGQLAAMDNVNKKLENIDLDPKPNADGISMLDENFEIDIKDGNIPPLVLTKSARFIHDFSVNVTGIVDVEGQRCFVMPLIRNSVTPPTSLYDLLFKMSNGYYTIDMKKLMSNMRIVEPAIKDLSDQGLYISKDCANYPTYKLEKTINAIAK